MLLNVKLIVVVVVVDDDDDDDDLVILSVLLCVVSLSVWVCELSQIAHYNSS